MVGGQVCPSCASIVLGAWPNENEAVPSGAGRNEANKVAALSHWLLAEANEHGTCRRQGPRAAPRTGA